MNAPLLSRRAFIAAGLTVAGGLYVSVASRRAFAMPIGPAPWPDEGARPNGEVDAFVVIEPDETILLRIAKSEMGQGVMTSLAMIVARDDRGRGA
jgi:isoquinoline 1-oxidoreductase beta subunit